MIDHYNYTLIEKELSGTITNEESILLHEWRSASPENEDAYQNLFETWHLINASSNWVIPNKDSIWHRIEAKVNSPVIRKYTKSTLVKVASIAASIAIIISIGISYMYISGAFFVAEPFLVNAPHGEKSEIILPDGSKVWLNSGSTLKYYTNYNRNNRIVELDGEAFFDITPNEKLAFDVLLKDGIKVHVYGTQFNVEAYSETNNIAVSLLKGAVSLRFDKFEDNEVLLTPNKKIIVDKEKNTYQLMSCDAEIESLWRFGRLKIEQATLTQIIEKMERWYGVNIDMKDKDSGKLYWLTIKTESLTEMLELINKITPIKYKITGEEVTIEYK